MFEKCSHNILYRFQVASSSYRRYVKCCVKCLLSHIYISLHCIIIMAALCNRAGHYVFARWFLSSSSIIFSSPNLSGRRLDVYHTSTCRSEMCCTWLAANTGRKKVAKNRHLGTIAQLCRAISSQLRHVLTIRKKTC